MYQRIQNGPMWYCILGTWQQFIELASLRFTRPVLFCFVSLYVGSFWIGIWSLGSLAGLERHWKVLLRYNNLLHPLEFSWFLGSQGWRHFLQSRSKLPSFSRFDGPGQPYFDVQHSWCGDSEWRPAAFNLLGLVGERSIQEINLFHFSALFQRNMSPYSMKQRYFQIIESPPNRNRFYCMYTVYSIQYTVYSIQYTVYSIQYTV